MAHLFAAHPGLVAADRLVKIVRRSDWSGHVYDLSTRSKWYLANGIISHNCTIAALGHLTQLDAALAGQTVTPSDDEVIRYYSRITGQENPGHGYDPHTGANDNGAVELDVLRYWRRFEFSGHRLYAFARVDPHNQTMMRAGSVIFAGLYVGLALPISAGDQNARGQTWDDIGDSPSAEPGSWGGHAVNTVGYDADGLTCITWGKPQRMTWRFWHRYGDEAYACLTDLWRKRDPHPAIDWQALNQYLRLIGALVSTPIHAS